jgi:hypothetical protein
MKNITNILLLFCTVISFASCDSVQDGYISDSIIYTRNPFVVPAGKTTYSEAPNLAGTSYPVQFELLEVRNENGEIDTELTKLRDLYVWKEPFNPSIHNTIEKVKAIRELVPEQPTVHLLPGSGQLMFTEATSQVLPGKYSLSMKMTNSAGSRVFKDIVTIILDNTPYAYENQNHNIASTGSGFIEPGGVNSDDVKGVAITPATAEVIHNLEGPNKLHLVIKDKNGNSWSWKNSEVVKRGDRPCLEYALPWTQGEFSDTDLTYEYPFAPFPFGKIVTPDGTAWERRFDYRILSPYVAIDGLTPGQWNCNLVFYFSFNLEGEWTFELTFPNLTRLS